MREFRSSTIVQARNREAWLELRVSGIEILLRFQLIASFQSIQRCHVDQKHLPKLWGAKTYKPLTDVEFSNNVEPDKQTSLLDLFSRSIFVWILSWMLGMSAHTNPHLD